MAHVGAGQLDYNAGMSGSTARGAACALLLAWPVAARAQNPSMSADFRSMMEWLTHQTVQGLAFNAGSTFDPPNELHPWKMQPDLSLGIGVMPLSKARFPTIATPALNEKQPAGQLPDKVMFPNLTLHLRLGLPRRLDVTMRAVNMTVPRGYRLSDASTGDGQSNTVGLGVRRHFFGRGAPMLSLGTNINHVFGRFNFRNEFKDLELTPGFVVDSVNSGALQWSVTSLGGNAVVSRTYGVWTPFFGLGYSHVSGSLRGRLSADFATSLIASPVGEASDHPERHQARILFGTQLDRSRMGLFVNGEVKAVGASAGRSFIVSTGFVCPFRIGAQSFVRRPSADFRAGASFSPPEPAVWDAPARRGGGGGRSMDRLRDAPASAPARILPELLSPDPRWKTESDEDAYKVIRLPEPGVTKKGRKGKLREEEPDYRAQPGEIPETILIQ